MSNLKRFLVYSMMIILMDMLSGCASAPVTVKRETPSPERATSGSQIVSLARSFLGTPYVYGGTTPRGFDCSGLVYFTHQKVGIHVPRSTHQQYNKMEPIPLSRLRPGDLLFFRLNRSKVSHVGIYAGKGSFIHAPSRGKKVSISSLNNPYWKKHLIASGRLY